MERTNVILATDLNDGIGKNGSIPWNVKEDMDYFRHKTMFGVLIMGRKTYESLGKLLPHRIHIVITTSDIQQKDVYKVSNFHEAWVLATTFKKEIWVIGGKHVYEDALRHFSVGRVYRNIVNGEYDCDVHVDLSHLLFETIHKSDEVEYQVAIPKHTIEQQYMALLYKIMETGHLRDTRSGKTRSLFSHTLDIDLSEGFPLLTTKKMFWKGIVEELLFFIRGDTNTNHLSEKGIKIWEGNTSNAFLKSMGLPYEEGDMGPMYGYQWRFFNKPYDQPSGGVDQLRDVIDELKKNPSSRRLLMTTFNPSQVNEGVLYPCHSLVVQFYVEDGMLSCNMYQRSADVFLGLPFNIASTSLLAYIVADLTNLIPKNVHIHIGDAHIYMDHEEAVKTQLSRVSYDLPQLDMKQMISIEDVERSSLNDYTIKNYVHHPPIKATMNV
jgi:thymidylate synthase/dihydrofolate reductase